jgi:hypothetical protein
MHIRWQTNKTVLSGCIYTTKIVKWWTCGDPVLSDGFRHTFPYSATSETDGAAGYTMQHCVTMQYKSSQEELHCQRGHKMTWDKAEPSSSRSWREDEPCLSFVFNMNYSSSSSSSSSSGMYDVGLSSFAFPPLPPPTPFLSDHHHSFPSSSHYLSLEAMPTDKSPHQYNSLWKHYRTVVGSHTTCPSSSPLYPSSFSPPSSSSGRALLHKVHLQ